MISITTAELNTWIAAFFFPLTRVLALLAAAPPFNNVSISQRMRLFYGLAICMAIVPALPPMPAIAPASARGLLLIAEQMMIGFAMGFALRLVFSALDLAGNIISWQMGLGFATAYDPQSASQTPVVSELIGMLALLIFLAINGHLMVLATLVESFSAIPVGTFPLRESWLNLANAVGIVFSSGMLLALPIIVTMLITNIALGVLGRVSPQLNLIVIGFPVMIVLGFIALMIGLAHIGAPLQELFEHGLRSMLGYFKLR